MPIYTNSVTDVFDFYVIVHNDAISGNLQVYLPDIMIRKPVIGDSIVYIKDDVDNQYGSFIRFASGGTTVVPTNEHKHTMMTAETANNIAYRAYPNPSQTGERNNLLEKLSEMYTGNAVQDE